MYCEQAEMKLAQYLFDELSDTERIELEAHLEACDTCHEKLGDMRVTVGLLTDGIAAQPAPSISERKRAALMAQLAVPAMGMATDSTDGEDGADAAPIGASDSTSTNNIGGSSSTPTLSSNLQRWLDGMQLPTTPQGRALAAAACLALVAMLTGLLMPRSGDRDMREASIVPHAELLAREIGSRDGDGIQGFAAIQDEEGGKYTYTNGKPSDTTGGANDDTWLASTHLNTHSENTTRHAHISNLNGVFLRIPRANGDDTVTNTKLSGPSVGNLDGTSLDAATFDTRSESKMRFGRISGVAGGFQPIPQANGSSRVGGTAVTYQSVTAGGNVTLDSPAPANRPPAVLAITSGLTTELEGESAPESLESTFALIDDSRSMSGESSRQYREGISSYYDKLKSNENGERRTGRGPAPISGKEGVDKESGLQHEGRQLRGGLYLQGRRGSISREHSDYASTAGDLIEQPDKLADRYWKDASKPSASNSTALYDFDDGRKRDAKNDPVNNSAGNSHFFADEPTKVDSNHWGIRPPNVPGFAVHGGKDFDGDKQTLGPGTRVTRGRPTVTRWDKKNTTPAKPNPEGFELSVNPLGTTRSPAKKTSKSQGLLANDFSDEDDKNGQGKEFGWKTDKKPSLAPIDGYIRERIGEKDQLGEFSERETIRRAQLDVGGRISPTPDLTSVPDGSVRPNDGRENWAYRSFDSKLALPSEKPGEGQDQGERSGKAGQFAQDFGASRGKDNYKWFGNAPAPSTPARLATGFNRVDAIRPGDELNRLEELKLEEVTRSGDGEKAAQLGQRYEFLSKIEVNKKGESKKGLDDRTRTVDELRSLEEQRKDSKDSATIALGTVIPKHDNQPILGDIPQLGKHFSKQPEFDINSALSNTSSGGTTSGGARILNESSPDIAESTPRAATTLFGDFMSDEEQAQATREEAVESVVNIVQDNIGKQDEWAAYGGQSSSIRELDGKLIVKTTPGRHRELGLLLNQMRHSNNDRDEKESAGRPGTRPGGIRSINGTALYRSETDRKTAEQIQKAIPAKYKGTKFEDVIDDYRKSTGANVYVNWEALESVGVERDAPVTLDLKNIRAESALNFTLKQAGAAAELEPIGYQIIDGVVHISTERDLNKKTETRVYRIEDLVAQEKGKSDTPSNDLSGRIKDTHARSVMVDEPKANLEVLARLSHRINANYSNVRLPKVIDDLKKQTGMNIYVDWADLKGRGFAKETNRPITLSMANVPAETVLKKVLEQVKSFSKASPEYDVVDGVLHIGSKSSITSNTNIRTYDIGDILDIRRLGDNSADDMTKEELADQIANVVRETVAADHWQAVGGDHGSLRFHNGKLIVKTNNRNHRQVRDLLRQLRGLKPLREDTLVPVPPIPADVIAQREAAKIQREKALALKRAKEQEEQARKAEILAPSSNFPVVPVNPWTRAAIDFQSTFALDVDTAAYNLARKYITKGYLPPIGSVRMEEYVNAFDYNYPQSTGQTFTVIAEGAPAPFGPRNQPHVKLLKVGVRGKVIGRDGRKPAHLVFVVDASGSMARPDRLPLAKHALTLLVGQLTPQDKVSLISYGSDVHVLLDPTPIAQKVRILEAINALQPTGATNLHKGVTAGYRMAEQGFVAGQINRVILCSDGIATLGETESEDILKYVDHYRRQGISFTSVGFGAGTYNDAMMEKLANKGDGSYIYVDSRKEARRVFVDELTATLQTIAKDAKIQVEFNPHRVRRYRLIGYENRAIADKDFRNDTVDAGEVGSGQSSTALYELELQGDATASIGTVFVRYKNADTDKVEEISHALSNDLIRRRTTAANPRFHLAACAAEFAEILRKSEHARDGNLGNVRNTLAEVTQQLPLDKKAKELLDLVQRAMTLPRAP